MADDKKNIPDAGKVNEPAKAENTEPMKADPAVPEQPAPSKPETPAVEDAPKAAVPPVAEKAPTPGAEQPAPSKQDNPKGKDKPTPPKEDKPQPGKTDQQVTIPGMGDPAPAGKVVNFTATRDGTVKGKPPTLEQPTEPRDATRPVKEEIVYLDLSELHAFKDHPFEVRDDAEMQALVESVKTSGVNQPALVRPREGGGYEIVAGHRRQKASELAGYRNMPCIVRNMTDDEAILTMTDDNLRHREHILPMEKARALKQQVEAIKHQGVKLGEDDKDAGKRSTEVVGARNGINYKQVQRYIRLNELVPELQKMVNEKRLSFTPAVEISFIRPKNQQFIAVSIEGEQSAPSLSQAQKLRELDKEGKLNPDAIDGILSQEKKEVDKVILSTAELSKYFGKEVTPRQMKDQIMALLDEWKEKQPPEKKAELEK